MTREIIARSRQILFPGSSHFFDPNCDNIERTDQKDTFFATGRIFRLPPSFSLRLIALPNFGAWNALSSVVEIFMVQLVKSRISSCKTTCSRGQTGTGEFAKGGGRDLPVIAPSRPRPTVIHFTALSILILRNSAAMVDHGQRSVAIRGVGECGVGGHSHITSAHEG